MTESSHAQRRLAGMLHRLRFGSLAPLICLASVGSACSAASVENRNALNQPSKAENSTARSTSSEIQVTESSPARKRVSWPAEPERKGYPRQAFSFNINDPRFDSVLSPRFTVWFNSEESAASNGANMGAYELQVDPATATDPVTVWAIFHLGESADPSTDQGIVRRELQRGILPAALALFPHDSSDVEMGRDLLTDMIGWENDANVPNPDQPSFSADLNVETLTQRMSASGGDICDEHFASWLYFVATYSDLLRSAELTDVSNAIAHYNPDVDHNVFFEQDVELIFTPAVVKWSADEGCPNIVDQIQHPDTATGEEPSEDKPEDPEPGVGV